MESNERVRTTAERQAFELASMKRIGKSKRREQLLRLEKERRGVPSDALVFVGAKRLAGFWWCALQSVLLSRQREQIFFDSYLVDRVKYAYELGHIDDLPDSDDALLEVGDDLGQDDIEGLLRCRSEDQEGYSRDVSVDADNPGKRVVSIRRGGELVGEVESQFDPSDPLAIGSIEEIQFAESHPSIRWHFPWDRYVIVGIPDGITDEFVYEFKSTGSAYFLRFVKPVATTQADIYGHLWGREKKRVQIRIRDQGEVITVEEPVNEKRVMQTLSGFAAIDSGQPARPPSVAWKCKSTNQECEVRDLCPIKLA